jgi:hypothetical protein
MPRAWLPGALTLATVLMIARAPRADTARVVERVVAIVDGRPILASELVQRAAPHERALEATSMPAWRRAPLRRRLLRDVLERLVEERLIERAAQAEGIAVESDEIEAALDRVAEGEGWSKSELEVAIISHGWLLGEYRRQIAAHLIETKLLQRRLATAGKTQVSAEAWGRERKRWLSELRRQSFVELRLSR